MFGVCCFFVHRPGLGLFGFLRDIIEYCDVVKLDEKLFGCSIYRDIWGEVRYAYKLVTFDPFYPLYIGEYCLVEVGCGTCEHGVPSQEN